MHLRSDSAVGMAFSFSSSFPLLLFLSFSHSFLKTYLVSDPIIPPGPVGERRGGQALYEVERIVEKREVKNAKQGKKKSNVLCWKLRGDWILVGVLNIPNRYNKHQRRKKRESAGV